MKFHITSCPPFPHSINSYFYEDRLKGSWPDAVCRCYAVGGGDSYAKL